MGWVFIACGCCSFAFALWGTYFTRKQEDASKRAESVKWVLVAGALACLFVGFGIARVLDIGVHLTVPQLLGQVKVVGMVMILLGVWMTWHTLRIGRHSYVEMYRGAALLPTLQRAVTLTGVAMGISFVGGGLVLVTFLYPVAVLTIIMGAVGGAGALVTLCSSVVAAIIVDRLKTDAEIEAWRRGRRRE